MGDDALRFDQELPPNTFTINQGGRILVTIHADGSMTFGEGYTPDAAAMVVWDAISRHYPWAVAALELGSSDKPKSS